MSTADEVVAQARNALHELRQFSEGETDSWSEAVFDEVAEGVLTMGLDPSTPEWRDTLIVAVTVVENGLQYETEGPVFGALMAVRAALLYLAFWPEFRPLPA